MTSVLVVYGSWAGSTAGIAHRLGTALKSHGAHVRVIPAGSAPSPSSYDAVVVGSAVHSGSWHPAAITWYKSNAEHLRELPVAVFSVCLTPALHPEREPEARGYAMPVSAATGVVPVSNGVFSGIFDPAKLSLGDRTRARMWGAKPGDFRDMDAIDSWAASLVCQFSDERAARVAS